MLTHINAPRGRVIVRMRQTCREARPTLSVIKLAANRSVGKGARRSSGRKRENYSNFYGRRKAKVRDTPSDLGPVVECCLCRVEEQVDGQLGIEKEGHKVQSTSLKCFDLFIRGRSFSFLCWRVAAKCQVRGAVMRSRSQLESFTAAKVGARRPPVLITASRRLHFNRRTLTF